MKSQIEDIELEIELELIRKFAVGEANVLVVEQLALDYF